MRFQDVVEGNILQMADKVMDILKSKYLISPIHYDGLQRIEQLEIPEDALREAIFNAIIHKDYSGAPIQLSVYNDKLILWNEGRLPEGFTIETLLGKHPSRPANKNIADIFFKAGFIEAWGRGIAKIINGFTLAGLPSPEFNSTMGGIIVTINRNLTDQNEKSDVVDNVTDKITNNDTNNDTDNDTDNDTGNDTDRKKRILQLIKGDSKISTTQLANSLLVSRITVLRELKTLKELNELKRVGSEKGGHWEIIKSD